MVRAAAAIIEKGGKILIARREKDDPLRGKWEFPGGKIQEGETPEECLKRELREELAIETAVGDLLYSTHHAYSHVTVELLFFRAEHLSGDIKLKEYRDIRWVNKGDLQNYDFPEANSPLLKILEVGR